MVKGKASEMVLATVPATVLAKVLARVLPTVPPMVLRMARTTVLPTVTSMESRMVLSMEPTTLQLMEPTTVLQMEPVMALTTVQLKAMRLGSNSVRRWFGHLIEGRILQRAVQPKKSSCCLLLVEKYRQK
jgi:hypothetical protein